VPETTIEFVRSSGWIVMKLLNSLEAREVAPVVARGPRPRCRRPPPGRRVAGWPGRRDRAPDVGAAFWVAAVLAADQRAEERRHVLGVGVLQRDDLVPGVGSDLMSICDQGVEEGVLAGVGDQDDLVRPVIRRVGGRGPELVCRGPVSIEWIFVTTSLALAPLWRV
jgi:hypothetical protein